MHKLIYIMPILLISCSRYHPAFTNIDEYEKYVRSVESSYVQEISNNGVKVSIRYLPTDAMLVQNYRHYYELKEKFKADTSAISVKKDQALQEAKNEISNAREMYEHSLYFVLTIGYEDRQRDIEYEQMKSGFGEYSLWLNKLLFNMNEYIYLETPTLAEVPLIMYNMERTFGMTKTRSFLLVFPKNVNDEEVMNSGNGWVKLHVKEFGCGTGNLSFELQLPLKKIRYQFEA